MDDALPPPSQASSHFQLEPVSGATLFEQEARRRDALTRRGRCRTGCRELDDEVLLGGFERGCVVGVSAEEEEVALLIGLQTVARLFIACLGEGQSPLPRATIITTLCVATLLPALRDTFKAQLVAHNRDPVEGNEQLKHFLERISISRVFDVSGLWEALGELDNSVSQDEAHQEPPSSQQPAEEEFITGSRAVSTDGRRLQEAPCPGELLSSPLSDPPSSLPDELESEEIVSRRVPPGERTEIADSEDEGGLSSPLSPPKASPERATPAQTLSEDMTTQKEASLNQPGIDPPRKQADPRHPDIILVTHMSTLLSSLFRQREKDAAHQMLQLLSSHLRYLTRSPDHGGPLIMILNSTNSSDAPSAAGTKPNPGGQGRPSPPPPPRPEAPNTRGSNRPLDPTLRSIFNPPPLPTTGLGYAHDTPLARRNKPSFGLIFTQLLDMHLLCTRVPRTRVDAEALFAPPSQAAGNGVGVGGAAVGYGWVVEVLLDEVGVWDGEGARRGARRASREQRWGAVHVRRDGDGVSVVDAFGGVRKPVPEIVLAAGFGGRRV